MKKETIYSGLDKEIYSMPYVNPPKVSIDSIERDFERYRDGFWGEEWERVFFAKESSNEDVSRYCNKMNTYMGYFSKFNNRQNVCDYWHIKADMSASGMQFHLDSFCLDEIALGLYQKGQRAGDPYCARVIETWDEVARLSKNTDKESFRKMEYLAYEEKLLPALILLGCMYLRVGLTKYADEVAQFMIGELHMNCLFLWKHINLCKKLRMNRCILAYGTILFVVILAVLVLSWKVFGILRFWPFVGLTALFSFIYLMVESSRSAKINAILGVVGGLLVIVGGGASGSSSSNVSTEVSFACYGWMPACWQFFIARRLFDM